MKTTPLFGLPFPEPGDNTETWRYWQQLAEAAEKNLKGTKYNNQGYAYASGWSIGEMKPSAWIYLSGALVTLTLPFLRTGSTIRADDQGIIGGPFTMATLTPTNRPPGDLFCTLRAGESTGVGLVKANGQIQLTALAPNGVLVSGVNYVNLTVTYPAARFTS